MKNEPRSENIDSADFILHCLSKIGGKWKPAVLFAISNGAHRFGKIQRMLPGITKQMLTKQLRELEADGFLTREIFAEVPPRVEYTITKQGRSLLPVVKEMNRWGEMDLSLPEAAANNRDQFVLPI